MKNGCSAGNYVTRVATAPDEVPASAWDGLLVTQMNGEACGPFMRHAYLNALHTSGSATPATGWTPQWITLWRDGELHAAAPLYLKSHSYGEYVFDWAWADAHARHDLPYYPKGLVAVPFTPVPGPRLLARDAEARQALVQALLAHAKEWDLSSLHILFADAQDMATCQTAGLLSRQGVQFHWQQPSVFAPTPDTPRDASLGPHSGPYRDFDHFLSSLSQDKRKKIRQERRKVAEAGVTWRCQRGRAIGEADWDFFYRCYARTYLEHGNPPYLSRAFFAALQQDLPEHWLLFTAHNAQGEPMACSLIALSDDSARPQAAYGRYWGALERVDCLHFEACYYQPLQWCIEHGVQRFEGGAQGEHKMARALLPTPTHSAHWLAHPAFADAVEDFLAREGQGMSRYLGDLEKRSPFKATP